MLDIIPLLDIWSVNIEWAKVGLQWSIWKHSSVDNK